MKLLSTLLFLSILCVLTWELSLHEAVVQTVVSVCEAVVHAVTFVH